MPSVADKNVLQDGIRRIWMRDKTGGVANGDFFRLAGVESAGSTPNFQERELSGDNVTFRKDSKLQSIDIALSLWSHRPDLLAYFMGGRLIKLGDRTVFVRNANTQPKPFELFIESDAVGENNEDVGIGEYFYNCLATSFNNARQSGEYTTFELAVNATPGDNGDVSELVYSADKLPFDITADTEGVLLSSVTPADGSTLAGLDTSIVLTYAEQMDATTAGTMIEVFQRSDGAKLTPASFTAATEAPWTITIAAPVADWPASDTLDVSVKPGLKTNAGVKIGVGYHLSFGTPAS